MRLSHIKLAGFKSFVDPTNVPFPGNLVGIVGPNGCGKSNIIDAVRWVMGESSAKYLRGESMADVIFNGSSNRKASAHAAIELHFDNSDGSLGGQYGAYSEIVVRRQVNLDGQSTYYLNGAVCRRRDITDIFLGTGLGPRSYAIIEQGTISRLIEAKPEELRVYLEEAAGISKYKERRRETELRMQHTRDNLARLTDLRDELQKQLDHLSKQAATAEKYQALQQQTHTLKAQLLALRIRNLQQQSETEKQEIQALELKSEASITELQSLNTQRETQLEKQHESADVVQQVQREYYELNTELARVEQTIQYQRERRNHLQHELERIKNVTETIQNQIITERTKTEELQLECQQLTPQVAAENDQEKLAREKCQQAETEFHTWQTQWDAFNQQASSTSQQTQVEQTRIQHLDNQLLSIQQRLIKIQAEQEKFNQTELPLDLQELQDQIKAIAEQIAAQQNISTNLHAQLQSQRELNQQKRVLLDNTRSELQSLRGRYASLVALQEAALGKTSEFTIEWLQHQHLDGKSRLAECIQVDEAWEFAVETVLGDYLEAVCLPSFDQVLPTLSTLTHGTLTVINTEIAIENNLSVQNSVTPLQSKLTAPVSILNLLDGIYIAEDLSEAMQVINKLNNHESVITKDGIWVGKGWLRITRDAEHKAGVIKRERELAQIQQQINQEVIKIESLQAELEQGETELHAGEMERDNVQQKLTNLSAEYADLNAQLRVQQAQLTQAQQRKTQLAQEQLELIQQQDEEENKLAAARQIWQNLLQKMEQDSLHREQLLLQREQHRETVQAARNILQQHQEQARQLAVKLGVIQTQLRATHENAERLEQQMLSEQGRYEQLEKQLTEFNDPQATLETELQVLLAKQHQTEKTLQEKRAILAEVEEQLRALEKQHQNIEQQCTELRNELENHRLSQQAVTVRLATLMEQLNAMDCEFDAVQNTLPENAIESELQEQLDKINNRIERLGPINLAAISEHATQSERKMYLDKQHEDLILALQTLEDAIRKIDKETRARFKEVYEKVNAEFQQLFPRVFGGGQAYLELIGDDLLDTGVSVMARPPGKRNSTIHLLSGGEKALTAIALVFAIFQLNPAPFCMLDEVDAPLDDANIGRFCELVKEMSKSIQFIFISHNKLAIEMAEHLMGVTMNEPGVSRLVAVDVKAAMAMAES